MEKINVKYNPFEYDYVLTLGLEQWQYDEEDSAFINYGKINSDVVHDFAGVPVEFLKIDNLQEFLENTDCVQTHELSVVK